MANAREKRYLIVVDKRFRRQALEEAKTIFPDCEVILNKRYGGEALIMVAIKQSADRAMSAIGKSPPVFIDFFIPVDEILEKVGSGYMRVCDCLARILSKKKSFRIEVKEVHAGLSERAKSIEVFLGRRLENIGFHADLKKPEVMAYVVFLKGSAIIGHIGADKAGMVLDRFRSANKEIGETVNRSEFKMKEAVEFFGIDLTGMDKALDIGAAPGGWTHCLSMHGIKVVAVDSGMLDYGKLSKDKRVMILTGENEVEELRDQIHSQGLGGRVKVEAICAKSLNFEDCDIVHVKTNLQPSKNIGALRKLGKFDLLTIDTNTQPEESAVMADSLAGTLNEGARLVMTMKLMTMSINMHSVAVRRELSKHYSSIRVKKLPHNRRELTVYARFKGESPYPAGP